MKVCIIGGGISGLYLGYKLNQKGHNVNIFEKSERLGGRVFTYTYNDDDEQVSFEAGAGRFNKTHSKLMKLIKQFGLTTNVQPIGSQRSFKIGSREYSYDLIVKHTLFEKIVKISNQYENSYLKTITLKVFMEQNIGKRLTKQVIDAFGYNSEFELQNAYTSLRIFEKDFNDDIQYYFLKGGLSQIINCLHDDIVRNKRNKIYTNTEIIDYDTTKNIVLWKDNNGRLISVKYDKIVFCVTKQTLMNFNKLLEFDRSLNEYLHESIEMSPLHRIFAKFPVSSENGLVWFHDIKRTTTNIPIRYVIPINPHKGIIQISYTDKQYADLWNSFNSEKELVDSLMKDLQILYPAKNIPRPVWVKSFYWKEGATYWKPYYKVYKNKKSNDYYIAGEITSQLHSGWIEGSLESVDKIIRYF
jgi:protoporphyrinogen oxidase